MRGLGGLGEKKKFPLKNGKRCQWHDYVESNAGPSGDLFSTVECRPMGGSRSNLASEVRAKRLGRPNRSSCTRKRGRKAGDSIPS